MNKQLIEINWTKDGVDKFIESFKNETNQVNLTDYVKHLAKAKEVLDKQIANDKAKIKEYQTMIKEYENHLKEIETNLKEQVLKNIQWIETSKYNDKTGEIIVDKYGDNNLPNGLYSVSKPTEAEVKEIEELDWDKIYVDYPQYNIQDRKAIVADMTKHNFPKRTVIKEVDASEASISFRWKDIVKGIE